MKQKGLLIAAAVLVALSGLVYWAKKNPKTEESSTTDTSVKLANLPADQIQQITLHKKDATPVVLKKENGKWLIASPEQLAADQDAVNSITNALSPLNADRVIDEKPASTDQFGLTTPSLTVDITSKGGKTEQIQFGEEGPTGSIVYAKHGSDPKIYAVSTSVRSSFDKTVNDLRDKRLLTFDSDKLTSIELFAKKQNFQFGKNNQNEWQIVKPRPYRADSFQVEELLRQLRDAKLDASTSTDDAKKAAAAFATGQPIAAAKTTDAAGTQTLEVRKNKDDYYVRSSVVKGIYKVANDLGAGLDKSVDDFRTKKIYDFGFNDPTKLEVRNGSVVTTYQKSGEAWKSNGKTYDSSSVQAAIDKLRDLSASKFVEEGYTSPSLDIAITSNDGKRMEKVGFAKSGDHYIAKRENELALYEVETKSIEELQKSISEIKVATSQKK